MQVSTLRPGLLVSLKTQIVGNVRYEKETIESPKIVGGQERTAWKTERTIADPKEFERAKVARGKCRTLITSVCANSAFGLLCPKTSMKRLGEAIAEARKVADEFNQTAKLSRVNVNVIAGEINPNDLEAVRAIKSEVADLMREMQEGVKSLDPQAVRMAANKIRSVGMMLTPDSQEKVKAAIDAARGAARKIVKAGEQAASAIDTEAMKTLTEARTAFLDFEEGGEMHAPAAQVAAIDLEVEAAEPVAKPKGKKAKQPELEVA